MELQPTLLKAIQAAGALIQERFRTRFSIDRKKGMNNFVTEVDKASEQLIRGIISADFPDHGIIGEEYEIKQTDTFYRWIVDPIDGTTNFAHGIPLCCVSIAVLKENDPVMGAVFNPMLNELFFAEKGKGAYLNDKKITVSDNDDFGEAFLVTGFPYELPKDRDITGVFGKLVKKGLPVRRLGAAALDLCWVACGRFDGFWEYNLQPWDIAAGYLILEEAQGTITDFSGNKYSVWDKETLATNGKIHEALRSAINER